MDASLENPVQPPELSEERLAEMRAHLLDETDRDVRKREFRTALRSLVMERRRRTLVVVAAALAAIYTVPAVAQERWWWVTSPDDPAQPVTQVIRMGPWKTEDLLIDPGDATVPSRSVATGNDRWILQAYVSKESSLCVGISPDPPRRANEGAGIGCGFPVRGLAPPEIPSEKLHWVGFIAAMPGPVTGTSPRFLFGPAAPNVYTVDLENNNDGRAIRVRTHALPDSLGVDARFWIVVIPPGELVHTIVPREASGSALEHWRLPVAQ